MGTEVGTGAKEQLGQLGESIRDTFTRNKRVLSFSEYLAFVNSKPTTQLRSSAQYLRDCFDHYGTSTVVRPHGRYQRFTLFDCPFDDGRDKLIGQEHVQSRVYRSLTNFVNEGAANKLLLLHGPNGSSKSTFVRCIGRAMEDYSQAEDGAMYRFNWIFPGRKVAKSGIGFSGEHGVTDSTESFAHLSDEFVDAKLVDELRDHPMFLIPKERRKQIMAEALGENLDDFTISDYLQHGELSHRNRSIYEALLTSYQGDYLRVLRHVQVERFYVQHRYRQGYVTVEPQLSVDANERQVTADRSISALPAALQSVNLFEYGGELVNANRGLVEYSDLLKRPLEAFKYLLGTMESSSVGLNHSILFLDQVCIGTSNEIHLSAFKEIAEFQSFKGRVELVRVPYMLDVEREQEIYASKLREAATTKHVAPHCDYVIALWAVLTRIQKPMADRYGKEISEIVANLSPMDKAELYAYGKAPEQLSTAEAKELVSQLGSLWRETDTNPNYEGRIGASPRELQTILFNAANSDEDEYISPSMILDGIEDLCKQTTVYQFLRRETLPGGFFDHRKFIALVRKKYLDKVDDEVRLSLGLVAEEEYNKLFLTYLDHVMHWTKKEKIQNPNTGKYEVADESLMKKVEKILEVSGKSEQFRGDLISKIGAWSLDNPKEKPRYREIFASYFRKLRSDYYDQQKTAVSAGVKNLLAFLHDDIKQLDKDDVEQCKSALEMLKSRFGYQKDSVVDALSLLARGRYAG